MKLRESIHFLTMLTVVVIFSLLTLSACGQSPSRFVPSYLNYPINELPMYGGVQKTPEQLDADRRFVADVDRSMTRREAVDGLLARARQAMTERDYGLAMRRINQAWLLLPQDGRVYWQFALAMDLRRDAGGEIDPLWQRALQALPNDGPLHRDWGNYLCGRGRFDACLPAFQRADQLDPKLSNIKMLIAAAHYRRGEYLQAWVAIKAARQKGETIPDELIQLLAQKMPEPR